MSFQELVNMALPFPWKTREGRGAREGGKGGEGREGREYEEVASKLPLFLSLARLMLRLRHVPWAMQHRKVRQGVILLWGI